MLIQSDPPVHLTYCLNVHRGESWAENFDAIRTYATAVRDRVNPRKQFAIGLRLSACAARELASAKAREEFRNFLEQENLYVFTINGFPFGQFHAGRVKEQVYAPDWRTTARRDYTNLLAEILADLLPDGVSGSISTVPCSFKKWIEDDLDVLAMAQMLAECVLHLAKIERATGKEIHLGLEPEPSCYLETTAEFIHFFNGPLRKCCSEVLTTELEVTEEKSDALLHRHLGVCFDTCHVALQFEDFLESLWRFATENIRISKVQLSAALRARGSSQSWSALAEFCEPVYLHQTKAQRGFSDDLPSWDDLPDALRDLPKIAGVNEARVHFHVPIFCENYGTLASTSSLLTPEFFAKIRDGRAPHWEIETYTFDVLPAELRAGGIVASITREFESLFARANVKQSPA